MLQGEKKSKSWECSDVPCKSNLTWSAEIMSIMSYVIPPIMTDTPPPKKKKKYVNNFLVSET